MEKQYRTHEEEVTHLTDIELSELYEDTLNAYNSNLPHFTSDEKKYWHHEVVSLKKALQKRGLPS